MNARNLPGPGDSATWGHHAAGPRSPDFEEAPDGEEITAAQLEELGDWIETFVKARKQRDHLRMQTAQMFAKSLMDALIEGCPR